MIRWAASFVGTAIIYVLASALLPVLLFMVWSAFLGY